jgi:uncharacterized phage protein (TIGR02220 family)
MEVISFIQEVSKKGKPYRNVWVHLLLKYQEGKPLQLTTTVRFDNISASTYYRIIDYGISIFPNFVKSYSITKNRGEIMIIKKQENLSDIEVILSEPPKKVVAEKIKKIVEPKKELPKVQVEVYDEIVNFLNECTGQNYKSNSKITRSYIDARLKDGFTVDDFIKVISIKSTKWLNTKFAEFLRPQTLFSNKFESYLNEITTVEPNKQQQAYDTVVEATKLGW